MRSSLNKDRQTSLLGLGYCRADEISSLIKSEDKGLVAAPCPGNHINMVDCNCEDIQDYIDEVDGLEFSTVQLGGEAPLITDPVVVIPKDWFNRDPSTVPEIVGIRLGDILSHKSHRNNAHIQLVNGNLHIDLSALKSRIFQGKKIILFTTGSDIIIETLWQKQFEINLYDEIAKAGFYAVTGMNFSLFLHECPLGHLINLKKSLVFCERLDQVGVPVIPHVYAITDTHRKMWVEWLNQHPNIKTVSINTQLQRRKSAAMDEVVKTVQALLDQANVNIMLNGYQPANPPWKLTSRIVMANQFGLKNRAIIENKIARNQAKEQAAVEALLQQHEQPKPTLRVRHISPIVS